MASIAGDIIIDVQGLLNDPIGAIYPPMAVLPMLRKAYKELQLKLTSYGISVTKETSTLVDVLIGTTSVGDGSGLPIDFISPIQLKERLKGSEDYYSDMVEREWEPNTKPSTTLGVWAFREEALKFVGATSDRQLYLRYWKSLNLITDLTSPIQINNADVWLAQRTAALCALLLGSNPTRAQALMGDLTSQGGAWEDLKSTKVKPMQNIPVRRRRTRYRRP